MFNNLWLTIKRNPIKSVFFLGTAIALITYFAWWAIVGASAKAFLAGVGFGIVEGYAAFSISTAVMGFALNHKIKDENSRMGRLQKHIQQNLGKYAITVSLVVTALSVIVSASAIAGHSIGKAIGGMLLSVKTYLAPMVGGLVSSVAPVIKRS